jgi:predicted transcriptional regulator
MTAVEVKELKKEVKKHIDAADESTVKAVHKMLETGQQDDWWDVISDGERAAIKQGLKEMKSGKTTPHDEVMKKYSKWFDKQGN